MISPGSTEGMIGMKSRATSMLDFSATGDATTMAASAIMRVVEENFIMRIDCCWLTVAGAGRDLLSNDGGEENSS